MKEPTTSGTSFARDTLVLAAWFGLASGLVEGGGLLLFQKLGWLAWSMAVIAVSVEIIWISAVFNLPLFSAAGLAVVGLAAAVPRLRLLKACVSLFASLLFFDRVSLTGRLSTSATIEPRREPAE